MTRGVASRILIIDDASFMRTVLKDIIKSNGLATEIFEAGDGIEGVKQFLKIKPDLVTMDVNMPKADGIQALRAILKIDPTAKVIMISSVEEKHIVQDAIKLGARDYVVKPFDRSNVPLVINKVIRQK
jgi:two-component system chemotaxis response regulator CheY